ncbi:unnamed protein product [Urochloa humidicola]
MTSPEKRRRIAPPAAAALPEDLLFPEVLARLPVKSLTRFKSVCRSWRAAIEDPDPAFVRRHLDLSTSGGPPPSVLVIPREDHDYDLKEDAASESIRFHRLRLRPGPAYGAEAAELMLEKAWPPDGTPGVTHLIAPVHCDGLVALATSADHRVFVCNPATREFVALPPGSRDVQDSDLAPVALGFHRYRGGYVVARCFYRKYGDRLDEAAGRYVLDYDIGHEIFTLGSGGSGSWELTQDPPRAIGSETPVCTREAFYWHGHLDAPPPHSMLRFSLRDETFGVFACPPVACCGTSIIDMAELAGKLCCVYTATETAFDVWLADDAPRPEWSLRCRVDTLGGPPAGYLMPVAAGDDGEENLLLAVNLDRLCRYDVRRGDLVDVVDLQRAVPDGGRQVSKYTGDWCDIRHYVVPYIESLVPIAGRITHT